MTREKLFTALWAFFLAFCVSFGAVGSVVTAFHMEVSLIGLALWCLAGSLLCAVCYSLPLGLLPPAALALISGFLWQFGLLSTSVESLLYRLSRQYHKAYDWDIIKLNLLTADEMELQLWLVLSLLGVLVAILISWSVCRKKTAIPGLLAAFALFSTTIVVTDTVPNALFIFLLFFASAVLMLTGLVRRQEPNRANRLTALLALPLAIILLAAFITVPKNNYRGQELLRSFTDRILSAEPIQRALGQAVEVGTSGSSVDSSSVDLKAVGVRLESNAEILQVLTDYTGTIYLRGRSLDTYDGVSWTDSGTDTGKLYWPDSQLLEQGGEVMITTRYAHRMLYVPYYVNSIDMEGVTRGVENTNKLSQYSFSCHKLSYGKDVWEDPLAESLAAEHLHLSQDVLSWAQPLAQQITAGKHTVYDKAQAICDYVKSSATYDTATYRMPSGSNDFVRWFLEDSDTGYCVHFASAATVLLQAAGIPTRYITGYCVTAYSAYPQVVRSRDAHAWAEYWLPGFGWTVLEATPAETETAATTQPTETAIPEQSLPTQEATEPSQAQQTPSGPTQKGQPFRLPAPALWAALILGIFLLALFSQRSLRLHRQRRRLCAGSNNAQTLACWQQLTRLCRYSKRLPDPRLLHLAEKAKFSHHAITPEELQTMRDALLAEEAALRGRSVFHRLYYRLVLALY